MSYRLLVLPESSTMTPALLGKIKELVEAGATVVGPRPDRSPSLSGYPKCDEEIKALADELWGDCDGTTVKERRVGRGRIVWGIAPEKSWPTRACGRTSRAGRTCDPFTEGRTTRTSTSSPIRCPGGQRRLLVPRHRQGSRSSGGPTRDGSSPRRSSSSRTARRTCSCRWDQAARCLSSSARAAGSVPSIATVSRDGKPLLSTAAGPPAKIVVQKAVYGVLGDPQRTRDVRTKVQQIVDAGEDRFQVARLAAGDDPAFGVVKTRDRRLHDRRSARHGPGDRSGDHRPGQRADRRACRRTAPRS